MEHMRKEKFKCQMTVLSRSWRRENRQNFKCSLRISPISLFPPPPLHSRRISLDNPFLLLLSSLQVKFTRHDRWSLPRNERSKECSVSNSDAERSVNGTSFESILERR